MGRPYNVEGRELRGGVVGTLFVGARVDDADDIYIGSSVIPIRIHFTGRVPWNQNSPSMVILVSATSVATTTFNFPFHFLKTFTCSSCGTVECRESMTSPRMTLLDVRRDTRLTM